MKFWDGSYRVWDIHTYMWYVSPQRGRLFCVCFWCVFWLILSCLRFHCCLLLYSSVFFFFAIAQLGYIGVDYCPLTHCTRPPRSPTGQPEISEAMLTATQRSSDRPDAAARVCRLKLKALERNLFDNGRVGRAVAR